MPPPRAGNVTEEEWHDVPRSGDIPNFLWKLLNPTYLPGKAVEAALPYTPMGHAADILYNRKTQEAYREALRKLMQYIPLPSPRKW